MCKGRVVAPPTTAEAISPTSQHVGPTTKSRPMPKQLDTPSSPTSSGPSSCCGSPASATSSASTAFSARRGREDNFECLQYDEPPIPSETQLREDMLNELERRGASRELLDAWSHDSEKVLSDAAAATGSADEHERRLSPEMREIALRHMHALCSLLGLPHTAAWFDAVQMLDLYALTGRLNVQKLLVTCTSIVCVLRKSDSCGKDILAAAAKAAESPMMMKIGPTSEPITLEDVRSEERRILTALRWQIHRPSTYSWLKLLCDRMDVLLQERWDKTMGWVFRTSTNSATILMRHFPAFKDTSPQRMANGLLCCFLVSACLLPLDSLRPSSVSVDDWRSIFCESQCQSVAPTCMYSVSAVNNFLGVLRLATGSRLALLQSDMHMIMCAMRQVAKRNLQDHAHETSSRSHHQVKDTAIHSI